MNIKFHWRTAWHDSREGRGASPSQILSKSVNPLRRQRFFDF